jgi:hypothetical protein
MISYSSPIRPAIDSTFIFIFPSFVFTTADANGAENIQGNAGHRERAIVCRPGLEINKQSSLFLPKLRFLLNIWKFFYEGKLSKLQIFLYFRFVV